MDKPNVLISREDWSKILTYAEAAHDMHGTEIGGMAHAFNENGQWTIKDPVIIKQTISTANCTLDKESLAEYYSSSVKHYNKEDITSDKFLYVWWHSHHKMQAFWSGTDEQTILDAAKNGPSMNLVVNIKGDYKLTYTINEPIKAFVNCDVKFIADSIDDYAAVKAEITKKCKLSSQRTLFDSYKNEEAVRPGYEYNTAFGQGDIFAASYQETVDKDMAILDAKEEPRVQDDKRNYMLEIAFDDINDSLIDYVSDAIDYKALKHLIKEINFKNEQYNIEFKIPTMKEVHGTSAQLLLKVKKEEKNV